MVDKFRVRINEAMQDFKNLHGADEPCYAINFDEPIHKFIFDTYKEAEKFAEDHGLLVIEKWREGNE